ncbi:MAG: head-tail connector protein [Planctomycetota bacterium]
MGIEILSQSAGVLDVAAIKQHIRVEYDDEDTIIEGMADAAVGWFENRCNISIAHTHYALTVNAFPHEGNRSIRLPRPPSITVGQITYADPEGEEQTLPAEAYRLDATVRPGRVIPLRPWPATTDEPGRIRIQYEAGFTSANDLPPLLRQGLYLLVGHWYENRAATADREAKQVPFALDSIVERFRYPEIA